ncbi:hypothetical protein [Promicromonospora sp. NFX87]|uniref:hypothetical protein n=1 Tax=Promicromonospora sp. NFX87 TaxID=3402691 RepID=UPI003AFB5A85
MPDIPTADGSPLACTTCGLVLDESTAVRDASKPSGYRSRCKTCHAERMAVARASRGAKWAFDVIERYAFALDGAVLVGEIGRLIDRADWLDAAVAKLDEPTITTARGVVQLHPVIAEARQTFNALQRALATLALDPSDMP